MKKVPEVGDTIILKEFAFDNKGGGTAMSNWDHNEKYTDQIEAVVTKEWTDYECGQRGWAIPNPRDRELMEYLERNSKRDSKKVFRLYWSEFDIVNVF
jgi:hypothetical protein